jgi:hypothetical protein
MFQKACACPDSTATTGVDSAVTALNIPANGLFHIIDEDSKPTGDTMKLSKLACTAFLMFVLGCSGGSSDGDSSGGGGGGSDSSSHTVSGTLLSGTISSLSDRIATARAPAEEYTVVAVSNSSNKTYRTETDANGTFELDLPSDESFLISYINDGSYIGPTVFEGEGTEAYTALAPTDDADLGDITVDESSGYALTAAAPDDIDDDVTVVADDGVPVGAGNDGKTTQAGITETRNDSDQDQDGVPNLFDADEDNDGVRNGILETPSGMAVESDYIEAVYMSSNIWADHDTTDAAEDLMALRLHVEALEGQEDAIASVQCIDVPSAIADVATVRWAGSLGDPTGYPTENSLWSDADFGLYQTTTLTPEKWIISIAPHAEMEVGDTFTIRVTYTDESYEDFFITTSFFIQDWAQIVSYNSTTMPTVEGIKTDPVEYNSDTLTIVFSKATDEDGEVLDGLSYSVVYGMVDCTGGTCPVPSSSTETPVTDIGGATLSFTIDTTTSGTYYVTPVAETADGQRNGEETWFTRQ